MRPGDVKGVDDLCRLPVCSRPDLTRTPVSELLAPGIDPTTLCCHTTSGSTGEPITVRHSASESLFLKAVTLKAFMRAGAEVMDRRAIIALNGGDPVQPSFWARRGLYPWELLNTLIPPRRLAEILIAERPEIIVGFPGLLAEVAGEISAAGAKGYRPRFVAMAGETITDEIRQTVEAGFQCPARSFYGSHEHPLMALECPADALRYHVAEDLVLLEVIRDGRAALPGEEGEVLITALHSFAMPLIRYRIGDWAVQGESTCACGAAVQELGSIMGRVIERFTLPDGRRLHPLALVIPLMQSTDWMRRYQLIQEEVGRIRVQLLIYRQPTEGEVASARRTLRSVTGDGVNFVIEIVDRIDPHPSGKMRPYFSLLPADPRDVKIGLTGRRSSTDG